MNNDEKNSGLHLGFKAKILGIILPFTILLIVILIVQAYRVSSTNLMDSSMKLLVTSAKDQSHQIEGWLNRKLEEVNTVKFDIEHSGALKNDKLLQEKLDYYSGLDSKFIGGFCVADVSGNIMKAADSSITDTNASNQIWFKEGLTRVKPAFTQAYADASGNGLISASAMFNDADKIRVLSTSLSLDSINIIVNSSVSMPGAESLLIDKTDGGILVARDASLLGTTLSSASSSFLKKVAEKIETGNYSLSELDKNVTVIREIAGTNWILVSYIDKAKITAAADQLRNILIIFSLIGLCALCAVIFATVNVLVKPLVLLSQQIKAMSEGDFTIHIEPKGYDEIGQIERSVKGFVISMREMIADINDITKDLKTQADMSSTVSEQMQSSSEVQAESMSALSDTVEQFSVSVNEIAENAFNLRGVVSDTYDDSDRAREQIQKTVKISQRGRTDMQNINVAITNIKESIGALVEAINKVGHASKEITGITALIGNISEETAMLSLNASIEAARAGESGRGFAIVATEISKLANTTAEAVENISKLIDEVDGLIKDTVSQVDVSVENINESGEKINVASKTFDDIYNYIQDVENVIDRIVGEIRTVNNVALDVSAISQEQAASTTLVSDTAEGMVKQAHMLAEQSANIATGAKKLTQTSEALSNQVGKFQI